MKTYEIDIAQAKGHMHHAIDRKGRLKHLLDHKAWDNYSTASDPLDDRLICDLMRVTLEHEFDAADVKATYDARAGRHAIYVDGMTMLAIKNDRITCESEHRITRTIYNRDVVHQLYEALVAKAHEEMMEEINVYGAACLLHGADYFEC